MKLIMEQKQVMKMVMTTELRQAIELLQLSTYELFQFIQQKAAENPFIELVDKEAPTMVDTHSVTKSSFHNEMDPIMNMARKEKSMHDDLLDQILHMQLDNEATRIVRYLILNIDEDGFVSLTNEEVSAHLHVSLQEVENGRHVLTYLEPYGIGARNVTESLLIQAEKLYPKYCLLHTVIKDHLVALAEKRWQQIASKLGSTLKGIQQVFETIQTLNPRPGMDISSQKEKYIHPDITIKFDEDKRIHTIQLHEHYIPDLYFNKEYSQHIKQSTELSQYVQQHFKQFEWLKNSIEQRRNTILKIMNVLIRHQFNFLVKGERYLKALTLKEVADEIEMHESTVSRATANKIVQTPVGIFELRKLFSTRVSSNNGGENSQTEVKEIMKELVKQEDKSKPLSDQKIANLLKENNEITISRRTVAKYRDELYIPSSAKRKELKVNID